MGQGNLRHFDDFLKAVTLLEAKDPATRQVIAEYLGAGVARNVVVQATEPTTQDTSEESSGPVEEDFGKSETKHEPTVGFGKPSEITFLEANPEPPPEWVDQVEAFDVEPRPVVAEGLQWDPLIPSENLREVLLYVVRTQEEGGSLDIPRLVDALASRRAVERLPRARISSSRHGVQVLVDHGDGMALFRRDQRELIAGLERLLGAHRVEIVPYTGSPLRKSLRRRCRHSYVYRLPSPGTPILILGDLGLGMGSLGHPLKSDEAWPTFTRRATASGNPVVALVPVPSSRWPADVEPMRLVCWHDTLAPKDVLALFGRGHVRKWAQ